MGYHGLYSGVRRAILTSFTPNNDPRDRNGEWKKATHKWLLILFQMVCHVG